MKAVVLSTCCAAVAAGFLFSCDKAEKEKEKKLKGITDVQLKAHNSESDCWVLYNDSILDVTGFLSKHEGGKASISSFCGADITSAFSGQHGSNSEAIAEAAELKIGTLVGTHDETVYADSEVKQHDKWDDCWMIIDGVVYDVSNFFPEVAPNSQNPSTTDATLNKCGYNGTFSATRDANELTKRGVCAFTNDPISHMGWSQTTSYVEDTLNGSPTYDSDRTSNVKTKAYILWSGNSGSNKARRVYAATLCGTDVTELFHGRVAFTVPAYTDSNTTDLTRGQTGSSSASTYQFDHTSNNEDGEDKTDSEVTPYTEYKGIVGILLAKFKIGTLAK
jgi:cytochrome b involved in lipid metabolism